MLPSLGCFRSLECPFYNGGAGQCSRPYCHYRHVKRDPNAPPEPAEDILGLVPSIEPKIEDDAKSGPSSEASHKSSRASIYKAIVDAAPAYDPTPIAQLKSAHIPIPYTPTNPTRSSAVKKSKSSSEYVPHYVGTHRPTYPPYCPSSISSLNSQVQSTPLDDPLKNPLYEIYGPEGAQYSPTDVDPIGTGYSYAPSKSASYAPPKSRSYAPYSPEYVSSGTKCNPQPSPHDSQLSDDDDNVDLAAETAAQTNGDPSEASIIDLDLSELDNLEIELESDDDNRGADSKIEDAVKCENIKEKESNIVEAKSHKDDTSRATKSSSQKGEKRRSSSTSSSNESKKHKHSHDSVEKNGHKEKKSSSSSSLLATTKKSSSSSSSSNNHDKKSSSHSSSNSKSSSSSSSTKTSKSSKSSSSNEVKKSSSSDSKSKSSSSSSTSSSKHKDKHRDKEKPREKHKDKDVEKEKEKDQGKDKNHSKSKHGKKQDEKGKQEIQQEKLEEEIRKLEAELDASLEDEDMIEQQCYEMFSEYSETMQNQPALNKTDDQRVAVTEETVSSAPSRKRIAHQASHASLQPKPQAGTTLAKKCSPYQVMRDRWEMLKKQKMEALEAKASLAVAPPKVPRPTVPTPYSSTNAPSATLPSSGTGKKKIAGVPNVAMLLKPRSSSNTSSSSTSKSGTPPNRFYNKESQRIDEFGRLVKVRVAHAPIMDTPVMRKPVVNPSDCRKFKVATRQANVNKLYQAYLDAGFGDASHDMALESERSSTQGTESLGVYSHRIIQILKDLRACAETSQNGPKMDGMSGIPNRVVSHNAMLAGKLGAKVSWSIQSGKKETEPKPNLSLYEQLKSYILTKEQLEENGFPIPSGEKGVASIKPSSYRVVQQPSDPRQRICIRCSKLYFVNKRGEQVKEEECFYHWGRKFRQFRQETKYTCCDGTGSAGGGCTVGPCHVFEQNWDKNSGYMSTLNKPWMESDPGVYALDCEMCYTTAGLELTRVTVIRDDLSVAYEALVKPAHKILDHNTRYSGITEEDLKDVTTSILQVQATLLGMFCDKTILIGHSLESDMKALKLIHPTVVDTSVVFPHKMGPPQKRALRNLAADYLKKIIQNDVGGHDSKEDAVAALELMLWKIKEDEKTR